MTNGGPFGIIARKPLCWLDAGHVGCPDADRSIAFPVEIFGNLHRLEPRRLGDVAFDPVAFVRRQPQDLCQRIERNHDVLHPVGNDVDAKHRPVQRQRLAVAVDNPPPTRRDQRQVNSVAFGLKRVALILEDREIGHACCQQGANRQLRAAQHEASPSECELCLRLAHAFPVENQARPFHRPNRHRSSKPATRATMGNSNAAKTSCGIVTYNGA